MKALPSRTVMAPRCAHVRSNMTPVMGKSRSGNPLPHCAIRRLLTFIVALSGLGGCDATPPTPDGHCVVETIGRMPLRSLDNIPVVEARLNGKPVLFMVDTGAFNSVLYLDATRDIGLDYTGKFIDATGARGHETQQIVLVDTLDLGTGKDTGHYFALSRSSLHSTRPPLPPLVGLLGAEILLSSDLVIDMPHHEMQLLGMKRCPYITPFWGGTVHSIPITLDRDDNKIHLTFRIDGSKDIPAVFDTGASTTVVPFYLARQKLGLSRKDIAGDRKNTDVHAIGNGELTSYHHIFDAVRLGDFVINHARVSILEEDTLDYALFGANFLKSTRVWISYKGAMYVQHVSEMRAPPGTAHP